MDMSVVERRSGSLDAIAVALLQRLSALTRVFYARTQPGVSRTEAALLAALAARPHRITELAAREGITQPAVTQVVNRLQQRGLAERAGDPGDARVVLARLTEAGSEMLESLYADVRALVHEEMAALDDLEVETLANAVAILDRLIARLGERPR
jgi:DNA-binding MarR family transcriptional regulator